MRIFTAEFMTEINRASPIPTGLASFAELGLYRGDATRNADFGANEPLSVWRKAGELAGDNVVEGLCAFAEPAGPVVQSVYESLRTELLADVAAAGDIDILLLYLHGAMVADACDDCEGDILARVRAIAGPDTVIGVLLDLHANLSKAMVETADLIIACKEYPHTDFPERADELFRLCRAARNGEICLSAATHDCRMIGLWHTSNAAVRPIVDTLTSLEQSGEILSGSLIHGFPWSDVADVGARFLIYTDADAGADARRGARIARHLAERFWAVREQAAHNPLSLEETLRAAAKSSLGPLIVADVSDNPGGGAAGDSTIVLAGFWAAGHQDLAVSTIWDPVAVQLCQLAGEGGVLDLRIGGKCGPCSGQPMDLRVTVRRLLWQYQTSCWGNPMPMGDLALVASVDRPGVLLLLNSLRSQTYGPDVLRAVDVDPVHKQIVIVKSAHHFDAQFRSIAAQTLYCRTAGTLDMDFSGLKLANGGAACWPITLRDTLNG
jgi:microcystin degradation protein MlrC